MKRTTIIMIILTAAGLFLSCGVVAVILTSGDKVTTITAASGPGSKVDATPLHPFDSIVVTKGNFTFLAGLDSLSPLLVRVNADISEPRIIVAESIAPYVTTKCTGSKLRVALKNEKAGRTLHTRLEMAIPVIIETPVAPVSINSPQGIRIAVSGANSGHLTLANLTSGIELNSCSIDTLTLNGSTGSGITLGLMSTHIGVVAPDHGLRRVTLRNQGGSSVNTVKAIRSGEYDEDYTADFNLFVRGLSVEHVVFRPGKNEGRLQINTTGGVTASLIEENTDNE